MVRYADDFIVLTDTERECREVDVIARDLLAKKGFELPPLDMEGSKTYVANPDEEIEFLGLAVVPVPGGYYYPIEVIILQPILQPNWMG